MKKQPFKIAPDYQRVKDYLNMDFNFTPEQVEDIYKDGIELISDRLSGGDTNFRGIASSLAFEYHERNKKMGTIIFVK